MDYEEAWCTYIGEKVLPSAVFTNEDTEDLPCQIEWHLEGLENRPDSCDMDRTVALIVEYIEIEYPDASDPNAGMYGIL